ncbi:protein ROLLING AND ERECT LEAF 2-like isoform X1 [Euphorbia lathyris]|uniref:protein ROLLING AND ERECT LEAF 2-like isoform X1 n=1 Tax=Euphorbia lathyris TaxID=212925 RepID=UPI003313847A
MGGTESKIQNEQLLSAYKHRNQFMKEAVSSRNAFAAAHSAYALSLKNTGAALSDFSHRGFSYNPTSVPAAAAVAAVASTSINRTALEENHQQAPQEKEVEEDKMGLPLPMLAMAKKGVKKGDAKVGKRARKPVTVIEIFADLDDHFLKALESTYEVSNMLEAIKMQFNQKPIDHFNRVMHVITWNRSLRGMPSVDDFDAEENEPYAAVSDEMLAWEKKLYDEVKAGEIMKYEYQKKVALLNKQKKQGSNNESVEELKASACQLHTRYTVGMQSVDSIVAEINHVRDERLYPKLVELVDGMATMWETMRYHHETQSKIAYALKPLDILQPLRENSDYDHYERTIKLYAVVNDWRTQFCRLVDYQKDYVRALCNWLKLSLIPIESNLKEKVSSPLRVVNLPIQELLLAWNDDLDKLPDELARSAMSNFAAVMQTIMYQQEEEMKVREKCEAILKEFDLKSRQYQDWCMKNGVNEELVADNTLKAAKEAREALLISLEEDEKARWKSCKQAREKSLANFKRCLPELFRAMSEFAQACSIMYSNLRSIAGENQ